jgi:hypothetical protein
LDCWAGGMGSTNSSLGFYKPKEERKGEIIKHMPAMHVILLTVFFTIFAK